MHVAFGELRSIPKRYYELRLILMIFRARKTRWARMWMRFYGPDKDFSHEKLSLIFFRQIAELVLRRGHQHRVQYREFTRTKRTLSLSSNREKEGKLQLGFGARQSCGAGSLGARQATCGAGSQHVVRSTARTMLSLS